MRQSMIALVAGVAFLAFFLGACGSESPVEPTASRDASAIGSALKSDHIVGVHSATMRIYAIETNIAPVKVYRVTGDWVEATVTFNSFGGQYDPAALDFFMVDELGYREVDLTDLVAGWVAGDFPNFGLLLDQDTDGTPWAKYNSREAGSFPPVLEVCYETLEGGIECVTVEAAADAYIWSLHPDDARGDDVALYTGWITETEHEKQSLLRFELTEIPDDPEDPEGCSLTPGYWMTHSEYGPAPYDPTWAELPDGADTPFFLSGKSYLQVLHTPPAGGHAYYILAFQYIAAELNRFAGADLAAVQAAFDGATAIFETYTPDQVKNFSRPMRAQLIEWADLLDEYNNGLIGPGHCDD
jgi:hypothetical protein